MPAPGYRWVVLAVGTAARACVSAAMFSVAVLAPQLRAEFDLTIAETGIVLAAFTIGMTPALLPWGLLADRALVSATSWRTAFLVAGLFPLLGWAVFREGRVPVGGSRRSSGSSAGGQPASSALRSKGTTSSGSG